MKKYYILKKIILEHDDFSSFILLEDEVHVFNLDDDIFITLINKISLIWYDGPLSKKDYQIQL